MYTRQTRTWRDWVRTIVEFAVVVIMVATVVKIWTL